MPTPEVTPNERPGWLKRTFSAFKRFFSGKEAPLQPPPTAWFSDVLEEELAYIRRRRYGHEPARGVHRSLVGVAFSGGGIRSATTNLGVLQALSKMGILQMTDYICTVSGGGFIGSCLSSLLSLEDQPATGKAPPVVAKGRRPMFGTDWASFPFNWTTARGAAQLRHLRTHGTFLVTRKGLLARETMRSVGHLLSGTLYHLSMALLAMGAIGLLYMSLLLAAGPAVDDTLRRMTPPVPAFGTAYEERFEGGAVPTFRGEATEFAAERVPELHITDTPPTYVQSTTFAYPSLFDRVTTKAQSAFTDAVNAAADNGQYVVVSIAFGVFIALAAFVYLSRYRVIARYITPLSQARPGESQEDFFATCVLRVAGRISLAAVIVWCLVPLIVLTSDGMGTGAVAPWVGSQVSGWLPAWVSSLGGSAAQGGRWLVSGFVQVVRAVVPANTGAPLVLMFLPVMTVASIRVTTWCLHVWFARRATYWTRDLRSLWSAYQAMATYALWSAVMLAAFPVAVYTFREHQTWVGLSGILSLVLARLLTFREGHQAAPSRVPASVRKWMLGLAMGGGLVLLLVALCAFLVPDEPFVRRPAGQPRPDRADVEQAWRNSVQSAAGDNLTVGLLALGGFVVLGFVGSANKLSPHYFYRDRLAEAYLATDEKYDSDPPVAATFSLSWRKATSRNVHPHARPLRTMRDDMEMPLAQLHYQDAAHGPAAPAAPYHLISCAINLAASRDLTRKDRKSGYFLFSKFFCGSTHTGFIRTDRYRKGETKLARAITISGAAASSAIGAGTYFAQALATVLFNLRLGYWMSNPGHQLRESPQSVVFWPKWLWREITMRTDERHELINLSDGGHTGDNVGIYPLLQRQCKLIVACDAECDPSVGFDSFTEAIRHAYVDLGIDIDIDLTMIRPDTTTGVSRSHCAVGLIKYPKTSTGTHPVGYLIYLKNSLTGDEPEPVLNYKTRHSAFPHESTVDQFFDDAQFESYRSLGYHIAEHAFAGWIDTPQFKMWLRTSAPVSRVTV